MVDRLRRAPAWAWLALIVAGSIAFRAWLGSRMPAPFIFTDELSYQENARSLAAGNGIQVRDEPFGIVSVLYPLLLAPAYMALRLAAGRVCRCENDQRGRDVARRDPRLPDRPQAAPRPHVAAGGAARGRAALARVHRDAHVRERVLSRVPGRGVGSALRAGLADAPAPAAPARGLRAGDARPRAGDRRRPRRAHRTAAPPPGRPAAAAAVAPALPDRGRRRDPRPRRAARARRADLQPVRRLPGRRPGELRRRRRAQVPLLAPGRARSLRRRDPVRGVPAPRGSDPDAGAAGAGVRRRDDLARRLDADHGRRRSPPASPPRSWSGTCSCSRRCS